MQIHQVKRNNPNIKSKRVGRGGKRGKTSGHGTKGQKARSGRKMRPEWRDIIKRLPKRRGYGKNRSRTVNSTRLFPVAVNLVDISASFKDGETVTKELLLQKGLISKNKGKMPMVKILSGKVFDKKITISGCLVSTGAKGMIEKAGGKII